MNGQVIQLTRLIQPNEKIMSVAFVEQSQGLVRMLAKKHPEGAIASKLRITIGTLQNLKRGRLKSIPVELWARLTSIVASELRAEITRLEVQLALVDESHNRIGDGEMAQMAEQLEKMKTLLRERQ